MSKIYVLIFLLLLTLVASVVSWANSGMWVWSVLIFLLSAIKCLLVAFHFMELRKAHMVWKIILGGVLLFFVGTISLILM